MSITISSGNKNGFVTLMGCERNVDVTNEMKMEVIHCLHTSSPNMMLYDQMKYVHTATVLPSMIQAAILNPHGSENGFLSSTIFI